MEVKPETTVAEIKAKLNMKGHVLCFGGNRKDGHSMADLGIKRGETINVFKTAPGSARQASLRLKKGKENGGTRKSTAHDHLNLHQQTQGVVVEAVMREGERTRAALRDARGSTGYGQPDYKADPAVIQNQLTRGGYTATQLLALHEAANLAAPTRKSAAGALVPEKTLFRLALSLCSAAARAGSDQPHVIQSPAGVAQVLDYATLDSWSKALQHQKPHAEWRPPVHSPLVENTAAKPQPKATGKRKRRTEVPLDEQAPAPQDSEAPQKKKPRQSDIRNYTNGAAEPKADAPTNNGALGSGACRAAVQLAAASQAIDRAEADEEEKQPVPRSSGSSWCPEGQERNAHAHKEKSACEHFVVPDDLGL